MPTIRVSNSELIEAPFPGGIQGFGAATGRGVLLNEDLIDLFLSDRSSTGWVGFNLREAMDEPAFGIRMPMTSQLGTDVYDVDIVVTLNDGTRMLVELKSYGQIGRPSDIPQLPMEGTASELSPLVRSQVEQIVTGINSKLQLRLSWFGSDHPEQEPVSENTIAVVNTLVTWLCSQSNTVSATVSNDGMLSIATVFPNDVRVYVEIERDGSAEAAVTRERRYARDIAANTVSDLTPEVILAAVESI